jgi:hypothetical protein
VVNFDASLSHYFFEVSVAETVLAVPANTLQNGLAFEVPPFKIAHASSFQ